MRATSKPVSDARENRGSGNTHLGGIGEGKCNASAGRTQVYDDKIKKWVTVSESSNVKDEPCRGDFAICRETEGAMKDYARFKNPKDREKIKLQFVIV